MKLKPIAKNQTELHTAQNNYYINDTILLFSYDTPVACHIQGKGFFKTTKKFSSTTTKHINTFLSRHGSKNAMEKPQEFFTNLIS